MPSASGQPDFPVLPLPGTVAAAVATVEPLVPLAPSFDLVPAPLRDALIRRGFTLLTSVQTAILAADDGVRDLQISSQTGSGKTVALGFVLAPGLVASSESKKAPTTLVITPTRELAMQVKEELGWLFANLRGVKLDCVTGGTVVRNEQIRLKRAPAILVGTPGRLLDHIRSGVLDCSGVTQLVLDEADQMLDLGFRDDLEAILAAMPAQRRTHLISATFPPAVRALTREFQRDALHVEGTALGTPHQDIEHTVHPVETKNRYAALVNLLLLAGGERTLVFVRTRIETAELADRLSADGFAAQPISGELTQTLRTRTLEAFRRGIITALIATDVAARGLDIPDVTTVVHFDPPTDGAVYTHRSGRTGRAGQKGHSVMLAPAGAKRRVSRILGEARVVAKWAPVPDAATVRARQRDRAEQRLRLALTEHQPTPEHRELATKLLAEFPPADLVAGLLRALATPENRAPADVGPAAAIESGAGHGKARMADRDIEQVRFRINWGIAQGAIPKRILAHICRRGEIRGTDVGAIEMQNYTSTFAVSASVADAFAERVKAPDERDPHLVIERDDGSGAGAGPRERRPEGRGERPAYRAPSPDRFRRSPPPYRSAHSSRRPPQSSPRSGPSPHRGPSPHAVSPKPVSPKPVPPKPWSKRARESYGEA